MRCRARLWIPLVLLAVSSATAAERVVFRDGRYLLVASWSAEGAWARLELRSGARVAVPLETIAAIEPAPSAGEVAVAREGRWRTRAGAWAPLIEDVAARHRLDPGLLVAVIETESNFDPWAISHKGACGLMQLLPETAARFGVRDVFDPEENLEGGARYLRWLLDRFGGDRRLALAAYNAGERIVDRYGGIPPYPETQAYVTRVLESLETAVVE